MLWPYIICLLVNLIPFESFAMENVELPFSEEEISLLQNNEEGPIDGPPSQALQPFAGVQNVQDASTQSNQALIIPQTSGLYNNPNGYVNTPQGNIAAFDYVAGNMKIGERYYSAAESLENRGLVHGAVLNYKQAYNRFELCDQGMKIDLASSVDSVLANQLRSELSDIVQRQETELGPYQAKARQKVIDHNPAESIQTESALTRAKSAVAETWNDHRFQTALSVAQGPLSALGVVAFKCVVKHYTTNNR